MFFLLSCFIEEPKPHRTYIAQLHHIQKNPKEWRSCKEIQDQSLVLDCIFAAVPNLSLLEGKEICATIPKLQDECYFLVAETHQIPSLCKKSDGFQLDCEMHILTKKLQSSSFTDYTTLLKEVGRPEDDIFGWTAIYRHLLIHTTPLDPIWCETQQYPQTCTKALYGIFSDRLNTLFRCTKIHPKLVYEHSEELKTLYNKRQQKCP